MDIRQVSQNAVDHIIANLSDRRGLRHEWDAIDQDVKDEIRNSWSTLVQQAISASLLETSPLARDISQVLNRHSAENGSDTPDFILADFTTDVLAAYDKAVSRRELWHADAPADTSEARPSTPSV